MSILDKIKLTKLEEVSKLNKNKLECDRLNLLKASQNGEKVEYCLKKLGNNNYSLITEIKKASPTITNDKAAIMAGLNIASMYLGQDDKIQNLESVSEELDSIQNTLKFEGDL